MADVYEQNLPSKANLNVSTTGDYIRVVGNDNNSYKQLVNDVAKKIIENYTNSSLAGSSQSVKSALDSLNSKTKKGLVVQAGASYALPLENGAAYLITMTTSSDTSGRVICVMRHGSILIKAVLYEGSWQSYYTETLQNNTWEISDARYNIILNIIEF